MSAWKEIGEVGKSILKGTAVMVGTKRLANFADRAIPNATDKTRKIWERVKSTKSTGKSKDSDEELFEEEEEFVGFSKAETRPIKSKSSVYDADYEDKQQQGE